MADNLDIMVRLLLDKAAQQQLDRGLKTISKDLDGVDKESKELSDTINGSLNLALENLKRRSEEADRKLRQLKENSQQLASISQTMFLAGAAVVTGIFVAANAEAQRIKEAGGIVDETTARWLAANEKIRVSYQRIGGVALEAALPLLERAAELAEKGAAFVEAHPDLVQAALNIGLVVASIGAIGSLVAKGIRLYADIKLLASSATQLVAARAMQDAANKMLAAAVGNQQAAAQNVAAMRGAGGLSFGALAALAASVPAGIAAASATSSYVNSALERQKAHIYDSTHPARFYNWRPGHDYTGYAYTGTYAMAQDGQREFVLSGSATKAAERRLGAQLNEQNVMGAIGGGGRQVVWNDHRTFNSALSQDDLDLIKRETAGMLEYAMSGGPNG